MRHCNGMRAVVRRQVLVDQSFSIPYARILRLRDNTGWGGATLA